MRTYRSEAMALEMMRLRNRSAERAGNYKTVCVMVEGPNDGDFTLMDLRDAVDAGFGYRIEY